MTKMFDCQQGHPFRVSGLSYERSRGRCLAAADATEFDRTRIPILRRRLYNSFAIELNIPSSHGRVVSLAA
jgi:hypothetical protein